MQQSENIDQIAPALVAFQADGNGVKPDKVNTFYNNAAYVSMGNLINTVRPLMAKHDLTFIQSVARALEPFTDIQEKSGFRDDKGNDIPTTRTELHTAAMIVTTQISHKSGQWYRTTVELPFEKATPQGAGSVITYGRRYGLASALGIAESEDDDGAGGRNGRDRVRQGSQGNGKSKLRDELDKGKAKRTANQTTVATDRKVIDSEDPPDDTTVVWRNRRTDKLYECVGGSWVLYEEAS